MLKKISILVLMDDPLTWYWKYIAYIPLVLVNIFAIIKSLIIIKKNERRNYLTLILFLLVFMLCQSILGILDIIYFDPENKLTGRNSMANISLFIYLIIEYSIFSSLLAHFIVRVSIKTYLKISTLIFPLLGIFLWASEFSFVRVLSILSITESLMLLVPCFFYYHEILNSPPVFQLTENPSFWIVTGIIFLFICLTPVYLGLGIIDEIVPMQMLDYFGYILLILLFIKGISCKPVRGIS